MVNLPIFKNINMKPIFYILSILFFTSISLEGYAQSCDGFRYLNDITTSVSTETVQFGTNTNGTGSSQDLFMDIYTPDGDMETNRPVILFAFGGSFIGGSRSDGFVVDFCEQYAKMGYVTVGIDYRLYSLTQGFPDSLDMIEVVIQAVADMKAAVRYMKKTVDEGNPYGIDPNKVYVGGISAGAIAAAHTAYVNEVDDVPQYVLDIINNNGGIDGDTDLASDSHLSYSSEVHAVVNLSGALHRANFMEAGDAPVVNVHGDEDDTVPYGFGFANVLGFPIATVQGSSFLHAQALAIGVPSELYTVEGGGHVEFYGSEPHVTTYDNMIKNFLYNEVTCTSVSNNNLLDVSANVNIYPNPATETANIAMDGSLGSYSIKLIDQLGRTVRDITGIDAPTYALLKGDLTTGIYYVQINFENTDIAPVNKKVVFK